MRRDDVARPREWRRARTRRLARERNQLAGVEMERDHARATSAAQAAIGAIDHKIAKLRLSRQPQDRDPLASWTPGGSSAMRRSRSSIRCRFWGARAGGRRQARARNAERGFGAAGVTQEPGQRLEALIEAAETRWASRSLACAAAKGGGAPRRSARAEQSSTSQRSGRVGVRPVRAHALAPGLARRCEPSSARSSSR